MIIRHLLLTLFLMLLAACGVTNTPQGPSMRERAMRIQMGLTEHQVLDIMGEEPYTRTFEYNRSVWPYRQHYSGYLWQIDFVDGRVVALRNNISERLEKKHDLEDLARLQQSQHKPIVVEINPQHAAPSHQPTQAPQHGGYIQGTSPESFDKLVQRIKRAFHHEQMGLVEQAATTRSFTPQQVAQLMQIFDFRNERNQALRKLIPALAYLHDLEPIYKFYDFESERRELDQLIRAEGERRRQAGPSFYGQGTSPESFDKLVQRIKRAFHHEQMGLVEQAAAIYSFTPQQVAQLMQIFDFRNERNQALRKLIPALAYLHDLEPIYKLYDFESERRELDQLIRAEGERRRGLRRP